MSVLYKGRIEREKSDYRVNSLVIDPQELAFLHMHVLLRFPVQFSHFEGCV